MAQRNKYEVIYVNDMASLARALKRSESAGVIIRYPAYMRRLVLSEVSKGDAYVEELSRSGDVGEVLVVPVSRLYTYDDAIVDKSYTLAKPMAVLELLRNSALVGFTYAVAPRELKEAIATACSRGINFLALRSPEAPARCYIACLSGVIKAAFLVGGTSFVAHEAIAIAFGLLPFYVAHYSVDIDGLPPWLSEIYLPRMDKME